MAKSVIGALRVDLGLNSAQFTAGLKNAQNTLGKFGTVAGRGFTALAAGATVAAGALGLAVKSSIDHADALNKSAQKAGLTVEALSRLEFAAKLSDVSLEQLTGGLQKLSKSMVDIAAGKGPSAAFQALGISVREADGSLRSSNAVFADVADRFSRMENGATKTALAIQIFGKAGAELIPLLNSGRQGLADMAAESDRLGATISTKTAGAAEKFNDTLTRIQTGMQGTINRIVGETGLLDVLQQLADKLTSPEYANGLVALAGEFVKFADTSIREIDRIGAAMNWLQNNLNLNPLASPVGAGEDALVRDLRNKFNSTKLSAGGTSGGTSGSGAASLAGSFKPLKITIIDESATKASAKAAKEALKSVNDELDVMNASLEIQRDEWEKLQEPLRDTLSMVGSNLSSALGGMISDLMAGKDAVGGLIDSFKSLGDQLIQMALDQAIQGLLKSLLGAFAGSYPGVGAGATGAATYGYSGKGFYGIPSMDGGGYTGSGARGGGMDGKGGFLAMLHPDETVLDHTKGQGGTSLNVTIDARGAQIGAAEQIEQMIRFKLPGLVNKIMRDPYAVG